MVQRVEAETAHTTKAAADAWVARKALAGWTVAIVDPREGETVWRCYASKAAR